jgi:DNA polymerase
LRATQTVFGEGAVPAELMLIGEAPGDKEDEAGHPFVGPAGKLLDEALESAGIDRQHVYVTNAVKHFKWEVSGKRRLHAKPSSREIAACLPWLEAEIAVVSPKLIVCLGATAAQSLLGRTFRITRQRGEILTLPNDQSVISTWHPSSILRSPDAESRRKMRDELIRDLKAAIKHAMD